MKEPIVDTHENHPWGEGQVNPAEHQHCIGVGGDRVSVGVPQASKHRILGKHHEVVDHHVVPGSALLHVEPAEDVDDAHHHVEEHLFPFGHAKIRAAMHDPERHGAPVHNHEDAEVDVEDGSKEGEGEHPWGDGEKPPEDVDQCASVAHALFVVSGVAQELVVRSQDPGQRE